ncbi:MAG: hypothetical protein WED07_01680 [Candidatus Freyarchaeum deiterrae]
MLTPDYLVYLIYYEFLITALVLFVSANFIWRFWKVRKIALIYLALTFILFALAAFFVAWSHINHLSIYPILIQDWIYDGYVFPFRILGHFYSNLSDWFIILTQGWLTGSIYIFTFSFALADLANLFLYAFSLEAFLQKKRKWMALYSAAFAPLFIYPLIFFNVTSSFILATIVGLMTYIPLIYLAVKAFRESDKKLSRYGFVMIALTSVFLALFFVFFFIEAVLTEGWSIYVPIAWTMGLIASIFAYIGYVLPNWFRRLVGEKTPGTKAKPKK